MFDVSFFFFWEILRQIVQQFLKKKREHYMYISVLVERDPREMSTHEYPDCTHDVLVFSEGNFFYVIV